MNELALYFVVVALAFGVIALVDLRARRRESRRYAEMEERAYRRRLRRR